jgi:multiple sugar transport system ATP-binding protein
VLVESLGSDLLTHVEVDAPAVLAGERLEVARELHGGEVNGSPPEQARITARLEPKFGAKVGDRIRLAIDPERLHFFDPQSERALP